MIQLDMSVFKKTNNADPDQLASDQDPLCFLLCLYIHANYTPRKLCL